MKKPKKTRRKRVHWALSFEQVNALKLELTECSNQELADKIGISLGQLQNPLYGISDCSKASHIKIVRYLEKAKRKP